MEHVYLLFLFLNLKNLKNSLYLKFTLVFLFQPGLEIPPRIILISNI
jgi:hypothetical protein